MIKGSHTQLTTNQFTNKINQKIPFKENYTYEGEFPDIKPPVTTTSQTRFGECLVLAGTESFEPVTIYTSAAENPTQAGDIIAVLPINPQLLAATRLSKLSENYTTWYPRRLVVEYVPQGSALDIGALISIPIMDPEDSFTGSTGNDAIRRALAYDRSVNFNIFDKPQFMLPPSEEDEPFFVTAGQNARQEISHVWHCMAQSGFPARGTETERILGWFKLHYVIELYEPKIPEVNVPLSNQVDYTVTNPIPIIGFFGTATNAGDPICTSTALTTGIPDTGGVLYPHTLQMRLDAPILITGSTQPLELEFIEGSVSLKAGTIIFLRLRVAEAECYEYYTNYSDLFNNSNQGRFSTSLTPGTFMSGQWTVQVLTATV